MARFRVESELSAEEEDSGAVVEEVTEVTEATRGRFQGLDAAVEAFGGAVADAVAEPGQDVVEPLVDHLGRLFSGYRTPLLTRRVSKVSAIAR